MARLVVFFAIWSFLAGCAGPDRPTPIKGTGEQLGPPEGWRAYCERHPADKSCISFEEWLRETSK